MSDDDSPEAQITRTLRRYDVDVDRVTIEKDTLRLEITARSPTPAEFFGDIDRIGSLIGAVHGMIRHNPGDPSVNNLERAVVLASDPSNSTDGSETIRRLIIDRDVAKAAFEEEDRVIDHIQTVLETAELVHEDGTSTNVDVSVEREGVPE